MSLRLKKGDTVQVTSGAEKGKRGKVLKVILAGVHPQGGRHEGRAAGGHRVLVQGINLRYKHLRRSQKHPQGGRIQKETPLSIANVMLFDAGTNRPVRFRAGEDKEGKKIRVSVKTGKPV